MQNLKMLRQRIRSVQSTQKITKAMQMVAGAKLRRMQGELISFRPFADRLQAMLERFLAANPMWEHPLLEIKTPLMVSLSPPEAGPPRAENHERAANRSSFDQLRTNGESPIGLLVVTSDTGLCGTYNERVLEIAERFLIENPSAQVVALGKKGNRFLSRRGLRRAKEILDWGGRYDPARAFPLFDWLVECFFAGEVSGWAVVYTECISALRWKPAVAPFLPLLRSSPETAHVEKLIVEPDVPRFAEQLLQRALRARFARILLEAFTAEHSARMIAMKNATENATEMFDHLTLVRNNARQAAITKELLEVVSGAEALK